MGTAARQPVLDYQAYLALEQESDVRHEYLRGEAWAMAGGTPRHSKAKLNLATTLDRLLGAGPCQANDSGLSLRIEATELATYADVAVICGPLRLDTEDANAVTNPTAVFEVLSPSTEAWDRGGKFHHLRQVESLRSYVLIDLDDARVEVFSRQSDATWSLRASAAGEVALIDLGPVRVGVEVDERFRNLPT